MPLDTTRIRIFAHLKQPVGWPHLMIWLSRILLISAGATLLMLPVKAELTGAKTVIPLVSSRTRAKFGSTDPAVVVRVDKSLMLPSVVVMFPGISRVVGMT